jgi:hypothetical protein
VSSSLVRVLCVLALNIIVSLPFLVIIPFSLNVFLGFFSFAHACRNFVLLLLNIYIHIYVTACACVYVRVGVGVS